MPISALICQAIAEHFQIEALLARATEAPDTADLAAKLDHQGEALAHVGATLQALFDAVATDTPAAPTTAQQLLEEKQLKRLREMGMDPAKGGRA